MAEKSFGVKEINLIGASGTPTIESPNNLNLNAVNVAISTNATIGGNLTVSGTVGIAGTLTYEDVTNVDAVGIITARDGIVIPDSKVLSLGNRLVGSTAGDLRLYHDGSNSYIDEIGSGNLYVRNGSNNSIYCQTSGTVQLFYNGNDKLATTNTGISVTGQGVFSSAITASTYIQGTSSNGGLKFYSDSSASKGVVLNTDDHLVPSNDSASDLGLTGTRWRNLYADTLYGDGSNLTNLPSDTPADTDVQITFDISASGSSGYIFTGPGNDGSTVNPDIYLVRGQRYRFINTTGSSHPFEFRNAANSADYTDGITGSQSGTQDFNVQYDAPAQLKYRCTIHTGSMVGNIYITGTRINNNADQRLISGDANSNELNAEPNLTFDGTNLSIGGNVPEITLTDANSSGTPVSKFSAAGGNINLRADTGNGKADTYIAFSTDGDERLRIISTGEVGINTTPSNGQMLAIRGRSGYDDIVQVTAVGTNMGARINLTNTGEGVARINATNNDLALQTGGTSRLLITDDGKFLFNNSTVTATNGGYFHVTNTNVALNSFYNNPHAQTFMFAKSRGTTGSGGTIVQDDDFCGHIEWYADDGVDTANQIAKISGRIDGTVGTDVTPGELTFHTTAANANASTERLRITSGGQIGVTKTPKEWYNSYKTIQLLNAGYIVGSTDNSFVAIGANNYLDTGGTYDYTNSDFASQLYQVNGELIYRNASSGTADNAITWSERLRIASDGATKVCHNGGAFGVGGDPINKFGVTSNGNNFFGLHRSNATTGTGEFNINVEANSQVTFSMDDEGAFSFGTTTDPSAQSNYSEKFRIDANGNIKAGRVASALDFTNSNGGDRFIEIGANQGDALLVTHASGYGVGYFGYERGGDRLVIACDGGGGNNKIDFITDAGTSNGGGYDNLNGKSPKMRITASGLVGINVDSPANMLEVKNNSTTIHPASFRMTGAHQYAPAIMENDGANGGGSATFVSCRMSNSVKGDIIFNGSVMIYGGQSDYRLKENVVSINDGIAKVKQLNPLRYNFISNPDHICEGFFAHEAQAVCPQSTTGVKDDIATEDIGTAIKKGDPVYQQMDYSKLVPLLTAALQEAITKIETLESKVATLEGS